MASERGWAVRALARRSRERDALLDRARGFVAGLPGTLGVVAAVVFGSVARGDFNVWSDVDVLVVARNLPPRPQDRLALLGSVRRVQPVAWTPEEFAAQAAAGNRIAREALGEGVPIAGQPLDTFTKADG